MSSRTYKDQIFFSWFTSDVFLRDPLLAPTSFFFSRKPHARVSTSNGLLYVLEAPVVAQRYDVPGTDFETRAIWPGYVDEPAAKVFVVRNARTIALREVQGT